METSCSLIPRTMSGSETTILCAMGRDEIFKLMVGGKLVGGFGLAKLTAV